MHKSVITRERSDSGDLPFFHLGSRCPDVVVGQVIVLAEYAQFNLTPVISTKVMEEKQTADCRVALKGFSQ